MFDLHRGMTLSYNVFTLTLPLMSVTMQTWHVILIIVLVLAVIWSNIALLKYSAKFELKKPDKQAEKPPENKNPDAP